jgi:hypothetical protein
MSTIKKVTAYEASDGEVFKTMLDAENHENRITKREQLKEWVEQYCFEGMVRHDLVDILLNSGGDDLKKIL